MAVRSVCAMLALVVLVSVDYSNRRQETEDRRQKTRAVIV
jgi:hypothetical protein